ncbi:MAG: hypothetical protein EPN23_03420 [Verrucomicrobia bacterium]|nr:MAG: hypothetical protein EPN23_03420 [Verrucomicrobiota bacterium]
MKLTPQTASPSEFIAHKRAERLQQVATDAPSKLNLFKRVYAGTASPRLCVKAFCIECVGYNEAAVRECTAPACPLWNLRPFQKSAGETEGGAA